MMYGFANLLFLIQNKKKYKIRYWIHKSIVIFKYNYDTGININQIKFKVLLSLY